MTERSDPRGIGDVPNQQFLELFSYSNPDQYKIRTIIEAAEDTNSVPDINPQMRPEDYNWYAFNLRDNRFAYHDIHVIEKNRELLEYFKQKLGGSLVVDLGGLPDGDIYNFLERNGVSRYVMVNRYIPGPFANIEKDVTKEVEAHYAPAIKDYTGQLNRLAIKGDMLEAVSRMSKQKANFMLNGIGTEIIHGRAYHEKLAEELKRVMDEGSMIWGSFSEALRYFDSNFEARKDSLLVYEAGKGTIHLEKGKF